MPRQDRTGPNGLGPLTGRGCGLCNREVKRNFGRCQRRNFYFQEPMNLTKEEEEKILKAQLEDINLEKENIENKLKEFN